MKKFLVPVLFVASGSLIALVALYVALAAARPAGATGRAGNYPACVASGEADVPVPVAAGSSSQQLSPLQGTPTPTPTACPSGVVTGTATIVPGTIDTGNHCNDCVTSLTLPFPVTLYGQTFNSVNVSSNGNAQFISSDTAHVNACLPATSMGDYTIFAYWDDLSTTRAPYGIYTSVSGVAPNRILNIEWRTEYFVQLGVTANFELRLYENPASGPFDLIYRHVALGNLSCTVGVQKNTSQFIQYACDASGGAIYDGLLIRFINQLCSTVTPVSTATPTAIVTSTATPTVIPPTVTATPTCQDYTYGLSAGTMISGTYDIGNHCDFCYTTITLPFTVDLYGQTFTTAKAGSKGYLAFGTAHSTFDIECLPWSNATYMMAPFWVDQYTAQNNCTGCGIYTATIGTAPNRTFIVEYRTRYFNQQDPTPTLDYEIQLFEGSSSFRYAYGLVTSYANTDSALTIGVQKSSSPPIYTRLYCDPSGHSPPAIQGLQVMWYYAPCGQATVTATPFATSVPSFTPTATPFTPGPTNTSGGCFSGGRIPVSCTPTPTNSVVSTATRTPTPTVHPCEVQFTDVTFGSTFYVWIRCLACRGIVGGYSDGTFRPNNNVTRGQLAKIVANSAGWSEPCTEQIFQDVAPGSTFFYYICQMGNRGYISGYQCGGPGEPCVPPNNLPYFRPGNSATRGQIAKIVSNAAGFQEPVTEQTFEDVPWGSTYFNFIGRLASRGAMSGYPCGGAGEPCMPPTNRPYFRPTNNATRGQTSKIVASIFFPACQTPGR